MYFSYLRVLKLFFVVTSRSLFFLHAIGEGEMTDRKSSFSDRLNFNLFPGMLCLKGFQVITVSNIFDLCIDDLERKILVQCEMMRIFFDPVGRLVTAIYIRTDADPFELENIADLCDMKALPVDNFTGCFYLISLHSFC